MFVQFDLKNGEVFGVTEGTPDEKEGFGIAQVTCPKRLELRGGVKLVYSVENGLKYCKENSKELIPVDDMLKAYAQADELRAKAYALEQAI